MTGRSWSLVRVISQTLERDEREAVLGDVEESGETALQALFGVLGLVIRRQFLLWKNWRPWLAAFGLALPSSFLLMGLSFTVSRTFQQLIAMRPGFSLLLCNIVLLLGWSWTSGFVVGSLSRRTVWVSAALSGLPCLFCLARFRVESLSRFCLLFFLPPAIWGVLRGLRITRIRLTPAIVLAVGVTALTIPTWGASGPWIPNWALSWPAWYLVATARKPVWLVRKERNGE